MGPTATWEYVGKISPAIPTLRKLVDHMEGTVNSYRRYKKHAVTSTEDDIAKLMAMFQESDLHRHVNGREVDDREKFTDIWVKGFNIVSKGESFARWFKARSELQPVKDSNVTNDYGPTLSELEEVMDLDDEGGYIINLDRHVWRFDSDDAPSPSTLGEC